MYLEDTTVMCEELIVCGDFNQKFYKLHGIMKKYEIWKRLTA